jgi:hypothetical protein
MYVTFHNDEAEHIDIDRDKNQHDDLTLHHLVKEIERKSGQQQHRHHHHHE